LYPLTYILIIFSLVFLPENTTWVYKLEVNDKEIIFQWMYHVGTNWYYEKVINNIKKYREKWYTIVYEGIKMEQSNSWSLVSDELEQIFQGTDFLKNKYLLYEWDVIWWNVLTSQDLNIDITSSEIEDLFHQKQNNKQKPEWNNLQFNANMNHLWNEFIHKIKQNYITYFDYKLIVLHYNLWLFISENSVNNKSIIDSILKDYRDEYLYNEVMKLDDKKIFIIYWEWHIEWFYNHVKYNTDSYIEKIQELKPFEL
jgi:hypothetical protein